MRYEGVKLRSRKLYHICPAPIRGDGLNMGKIHDIRLMGAEEHVVRQALVQFGERICGDLFCAGHGIDYRGAVLALYKQYIEEIAYGRISAKDAAAACYDELLMLLDDLRP